MTYILSILHLNAKYERTSDTHLVTLSFYGNRPILKTSSHWEWTWEKERESVGMSGLRKCCQPTTLSPSRMGMSRGGRDMGGRRGSGPHTLLSPPRTPSSLLGVSPAPPLTPPTPPTPFTDTHELSETECDRDVRRSYLMVVDRGSTINV